MSKEQVKDLEQEDLEQEESSILNNLEDAKEAISQFFEKLPPTTCSVQILLTGYSKDYESLHNSSKFEVAEDDVWVNLPASFRLERLDSTINQVLIDATTLSIMAKDLESKEDNTQEDEAELENLTEEFQEDIKNIIDNLLSLAENIDTQHEVKRSIASLMSGFSSTNNKQAWFTANKLFNSKKSAPLKDIFEEVLWDISNSDSTKVIKSVKKVTTASKTKAPTETLSVPELNLDGKKD